MKNKSSGNATKVPPCDRSQMFPFPLEVRDWVPEDNMVPFVVEAVEHVGVRFAAAKQHADRAPIAKCRRESFDAVPGCFLQVLLPT